MTRALAFALLVPMNQILNEVEFAGLDRKTDAEKFLKLVRNKGNSAKVVHYSCVSVVKSAQPAALLEMILEDNGFNGFVRI